MGILRFNLFVSLYILLDGSGLFKFVLVKKTSNMIFNQTILCTIWLIVVSFSAIAQESVFTDDEKIQLAKSIEASCIQLELSEEQIPKYSEIEMKFALQMQSLKSSDQSRISKIKQLKTIVDSMNNEMKALLSEEQYLVFEEIQKKRLGSLRENRQ